MKLFGGKKKKDVKKIVINDSDDGLSSAVVAIIGGIKNALSRGENLDIAMQTFVNAGYDVNDVMLASQKVGGQAPVENLSVNQEPAVENKTLSTQTSVSTKKKKGKLKSPTAVKEKKVKSDSTELLFGIKKKYVIIIGMVAILILGSALVLGLNWNRWF